MNCLMFFVIMLLMVAKFGSGHPHFPLFCPDRRQTCSSSCPPVEEALEQLQNFATASLPSLSLANKLKDLRKFVLSRSCEQPRQTKRMFCCYPEESFGTTLVRLKSPNQTLSKPEKESSFSCGLARRAISIRVVDVAPKIEGDVWPWMASYGKRDLTSGRWIHRCGGSLITSRHILTAAHCYDHHAQAVLLGSSDLNSPAAVQAGVRRFLVHPQYHSLPYFDVAVLILDKEVSFTQYLSPICLPSVSNFGSSDDDDDDVGHLVTVVGWGGRFREDEASTRLRSATLAIFPQEFCNRTYKQATGAISTLPRLFGPGLVCAGYENGGRGACKGDSGGPLIKFEAKDEKYVQVGLVQGGVGPCGNGHLPGIFVSLTNREILNFIREIAFGR